MPVLVNVSWRATGDDTPFPDDSVLSAEERNRASHFVRAEDSRSYAVAHVLLRHALSRLSPETPPAEWRFRYTELGKPLLDRPVGSNPKRLVFSLSHTRGLAAVAAAHIDTDEFDVGIDVEHVRPLPEAEEIARRVFSAKERSTLSTGGDRRFYRLWCAKEAISKAIGGGLSMDLQAITCEPDLGSVDLPASVAPRWARVQGLDLMDGFVASLALVGPAPGTAFSVQVSSS